MPKSLEVDPVELQLVAGRLVAAAEDFATAHQKAHSQAGGCSLGSGAAASALTQMLSAWQVDGAGFSERYAAHADDHRRAANAYLRVDGDEADAIDATGSTL